MDIRKQVNKLLLEKSKEQEFKYGCVMVYLETSEKKWTAIQNLIEEEDLYTGEDGDEGRSYGKEVEPHVTVLYGIHADVPDEDVEKLIDEISRPKINLGKVSTFENELFDVLKFDIESPDLVELNKKFKELPHTSEHPNYHPHATIAYLKKGTAKKYIDKFNTRKFLDIKPEKIVYSKSSDADGNKKKSYKFKKK
jgi:2'-5' RNA ligase